MIDQPRPGTGVVQQLVDEFRETLGLARLPHRPQPRPQPEHGGEAGLGGRWARHDLVLVEEHLERVDVRQVLRVHQVGGENQGGGRVMSEKHIDS
jgi:hypothetical protein